MKKSLIILVLLASCGGNAQASGPALHRTLWELLRGTCEVVVNTPAPTSGGDDVDGGVP